MKKTIFLLLAVGLLACEEQVVLSTDDYYVKTNPTYFGNLTGVFSQNSIELSFVLQNYGTADIQKYGVCWAENKTPTLLDFHVFGQATIDSIPFSTKITIPNLKKATEYKIRSFLITSKDTLYGEATTTSKTATDLEFGVVGRGFDYQKIIGSYNEKAYYLQNGNTKAIYEWNPKLGTSATSLFATLPTKSSVAKLSGFFLNDMLYCVAQVLENRVYIPEFWIYNIKTKQWEQISEIPEIKNTNIYFPFTDGNDAYLLTNDVLYQYKPSEKKWQFIGSNNGMHPNLPLFISNQIDTYIFRGIDLYKFDSNTKSWQNVGGIANLMTEIEPNYSANSAFFHNPMMWSYKNKVYLWYTSYITRDTQSLIEFDTNTKVSKIIYLKNRINTFDFVQKPFSLGETLYAEKILIRGFGAAAENYIAQFYPN